MSDISQNIHASADSVNPGTFVHLPQFTLTDIEGIPERLSLLLQRNKNIIEGLLAQAPSTWQGLMQPLKQLDEELHDFWGPIAHLSGVADTAELRQSYNACLPLLSDYQTQLSQDPRLYQAICEIAATPTQLTASQRTVLDHMILDFKLSGCDLNADKKARLGVINRKLSQLTSQFEQNVLDATQAWSLLITAEQELDGIPENTIAIAKQTAQAREKTGWLLTLDMPCYQSVMTHAKNRELREKVYQAFVTRASEQGPLAGQWDNSTVMVEILTCRAELAQLLGFAQYADYSLATKMAQSCSQVMDFLLQLAHASLPQAKQDFQRLQQFALQTDQLATLAPWDIAYYSEQLRQAEYDLAQEALRPYFADDQVLQGLFAIAQALYGITFTACPDTPAWHPDVKCFAVFDEKNQRLATLFLDLYARANKRWGAWMDGAVNRQQKPDGRIQLPVAYIACNFGNPVSHHASLLTHDEVVTLFHEFGHGLQQLLTQINESEVSGIHGVPWDAVELPSQLMEKWAWCPAGLAHIAKHFKTGESLPAELLHALLKAKNFQSALHMMRQLEFALFDFRVHMEFNPQESNAQIQRIMDEVRATLSVTPQVAYNRFQHGFAHIFGGEYAAGYYCYKWAEVTAADAFALIQEGGLTRSAASQKFQKYILETGGAADQAICYRAFRGHDPSIEALLLENEIAFEKKSDV